MLFSDTSPLAAVRRATALLGPLALLFAAAPAAGAATRLVAPGAANAGDCTASPCGSLGYAYQQSASGDVIRVAGGVYPAQVVPGGFEGGHLLGVARGEAAPAGQQRQRDASTASRSTRRSRRPPASRTTTRRTSPSGTAGSAT